MDRTERFYKIDALLQGGRAVPIGTMLEMLAVSRATFKRDIEYMRDRLNYPIVWDRETRGYRYEQDGEAEIQNLPGLWFNAQEAYALLMMQAMLSDRKRAVIPPLRTAA
jgi:predicted DNA-binding transcriptional regulator YafY